MPLVHGHVRALRARHGELPLSRLTQEIVRRLITGMVEDVLAVALARLDEIQPVDADGFRHAGRPILAFSDEMNEQVQAMRGFLFARMYRHARVMSVMRLAEDLVERLFLRLVTAGGARLRRTVCDYIAGMTDRYAIAEYERLFDVATDLR